MTQVSSRAIGNPNHHRSGESGASTGTSVPAVRPPTGLMLGVAALAFALAVRAPLTLTVLGPDVAAQIGLRFLVMFAFLQTMHYVVWVGFLPRFAPEAAAAFDARVPWLRGRRAWAVGIVGGAFLAVRFITDYFQGRALYGAIATYHAYLEFPVLLALIMSPGRRLVPVDVRRSSPGHG